MSNAIILAADNPLGTFATLDLAGTLGTVAAVLAAVVGGTAVLGLGVWQLSKGIDLGIKRFSKMTSKS